MPTNLNESGVTSWFGGGSEILETTPNFGFASGVTGAGVTEMMLIDFATGEVANAAPWDFVEQDDHNDANAVALGDGRVMTAACPHVLPNPHPMYYRITAAAITDVAQWPAAFSGGDLTIPGSSSFNTTYPNLYRWPQIGTAGTVVMLFRVANQWAVSFYDEQGGSWTSAHTFLTVGTTGASRIYVKSSFNRAKTRIDICVSETHDPGGVQKNLWHGYISHDGTNFRLYDTAGTSLARIDAGESAGLQQLTRVYDSDAAGGKGVWVASCTSPDNGEPGFSYTYYGDTTQGGAGDPSTNQQHWVARYETGSWTLEKCHIGQGATIASPDNDATTFWYSGNSALPAYNRDKVVIALGSHTGTTLIECTRTGPGAWSERVLMRSSDGSRRILYARPYVFGEGNQPGFMFSCFHGFYYGWQANHWRTSIVAVGDGPTNMAAQGWTHVLPIAKNNASVVSGPHGGLNTVITSLPASFFAALADENGGDIRVSGARNGNVAQIALAYDLIACSKTNQSIELHVIAPQIDAADSNPVLYLWIGRPSTTHDNKLIGADEFGFPKGGGHYLPSNDLACWAFEQLNGDLLDRTGRITMTVVGIPDYNQPTNLFGSAIRMHDVSGARTYAVSAFNSATYAQIWARCANSQQTFLITQGQFSVAANYTRLDINTNSTPDDNIVFVGQPSSSVNDQFDIADTWGCWNAMMNSEFGQLQVNNRTPQSIGHFDANRSHMSFNGIYRASPVSLGDAWYEHVRVSGQQLSANQQASEYNLNVDPAAGWPAGTLESLTPGTSGIDSVMGVAWGSLESVMGVPKASIEAIDGVQV